MAARGSLMDLCYADGRRRRPPWSRAASCSASRRTTSPGSILCHTRLLAADILLDRLETAGVADHLRQDRGAAAAACAAEADPDRAAALPAAHRLGPLLLLPARRTPSGLSRMELHAKQAYLLARTHEKYGRRGRTLAAINNLLYPSGLLRPGRGRPSGCVREGGRS